MRFAQIVPSGVLALSCCLAAAPVFAAAQAGASIFDFHFTLRDLDPGDGIAPSVETNAFATPSTFVTATARDQGMPADLVDTQSAKIGTGWFVPLAAGVQTDLAVAHAETSSAGHWAFASASGNSRAAASTVPMDPYHYPSYLLSPHTELKLTGWFSAYTFATGAGDTAYVNAHFGGWSSESFDEVLRSGGAWGQVASIIKPFELTLTNNLDYSDWTVLRVGFDAGAIAVTAVPEPSNYALMLGGLLVLGAVVRRRRL
ncbi:PEP-CTERM sorting domain-containing protein [Niveibacterium sp. SC-1]|uniref:PEP-CTERM sorting domain-containing protein n=1 Tax=Niveibacterium sp. SC-1 TaxID=3135646 RepID=UPI00311D74AC